MGNIEKSKIRERYKGIDESLIDVIPALPQEDFYNEEKEKRVAVYARVSTDDPRQTSSYELQKNHYTDFVKERKDWELVDIYADEGISGTSLQHREEFKRMISDCEEGKIDLIVTKSISRFARNLLDCVGHIRKLKAMNPPIGVFFETEHLYTLDPKSDLMLSFMATLAQEESHTKSEIMNASIEMRFRRGIFLTPALLGYDLDEDGNLVINEEEAKTVKLIFFLYLYGYTTQQIADTLTKLKRKTKKKNEKWSASSVLQILKNERHCGAVFAQKTWTPDYLTHKVKKNKKNKKQYRLYNHHESIVSRDDFIAVQRLIANSKYKNRSFLPELQVVKEGTLKGFVSINPRWGGFKAEDYNKACIKAYNGKYLDKVTIKANKGDLDFRGFEVAHGHFFENSGKSHVSITSSKIFFSASSINRLNCSSVELLLHPKKKLLAVRKSDDVNAVKWASNNISKTIYGCAFLPVIFELLGWNMDFRYRILGIIEKKKDEQILIFDLNDTEVFIPKNITDKTNIIPLFPYKNTVKAYPAEWGYSFGKEYYVYKKPL